jgi:8-oxo-dGTP diphosphatase
MLVPEELYSQIVRVMPIPCVDLFVVDDAGCVLLLLRKNEPAAGRWWFPGGRVLFGEQRRDAARRKLQEECGLVSTRFLEIGTFDVVLDFEQDRRAHAITTLYEVPVKAGRDVRLDNQSSRACWLTPREWLERELPVFVRSRLSTYISDTRSKQLQ